MPKKKSYYSGRFRPSNPGKYKGDPTNIIYRSSWEKKVMIWCDVNSNVLKWSSEEIIIPYRSPIDGKVHRYFPDFYVKGRLKGSGVKEYIIEVKPAAQCKRPKPTTKVTKRYINEVKTYSVNQAKWKAARSYGKDRKQEFVVLTEKDLGL
tara:strand:+ start:1403 stop:1852 length:450 start_codon:yes stop_codon:yes gene_type:complete